MKGFTINLLNAKIIVAQSGSRQNGKFGLKIYRTENISFRFLQSDISRVSEREILPLLQRDDKNNCVAATAKINKCRDCTSKHPLMEQKQVQTVVTVDASQPNTDKRTGVAWNNRLCFCQIMMAISVWKDKRAYDYSWGKPYVYGADLAKS